MRGPCGVYTCCAPTGPRPGQLSPTACARAVVVLTCWYIHTYIHTHILYTIYIYIIKPKVRAGPLRCVCPAPMLRWHRLGHVQASCAPAAPQPPCLSVPHRRRRRPIAYHPSINDTVKMYSKYACAARLRLWRVGKAHGNQAGQTLVLHRALVAQPAARAVHSKTTQHAHMGPSY